MTRAHRLFPHGFIRRCPIAGVPATPLLPLSLGMKAAAPPPPRAFTGELDPPLSDAATAALNRPVESCRAFEDAPAATIDGDPARRLRPAPTDEIRHKSTNLGEIRRRYAPTMRLVAEGNRAPPATIAEAARRNHRLLRETLEVVAL